MKRKARVSARRAPTNRRAGTFLILTAAGVFLLMGFVVLVADFGYTYAERQRSQGVLDMAGLTTLVTVTSLDQASAESSVDEVLAANSVDPNVVDDVQLLVQGNGINITIDATLPVASLFGKLFGFDQYPTAVTSVTSAVVQLEPPVLGGFGMFSCTSMHINRTMWSYDSRVGPNQGPPDGFPNITGCLGGGPNCGDELLIGSNGDVFFDGATVYGNVVAGGSILYGMGSGNRISGDARAGAPAPGGISSSVTVGGARFFDEPFDPIDCDEEEHLPDHFLDHDGDSGHSHSGQGNYTPKREVELDDDPDLETDGTGSPGSVVGGFWIETIKGPRMYTMGNRRGQGTGAANGFGAGDEDILFHDNPGDGGEGNEYPGMGGKSPPTAVPDEGRSRRGVRWLGLEQRQERPGDLPDRRDLFLPRDGAQRQQGAPLPR